MLRKWKVQISFYRVPDYCLLREDLKMQQGEQQLRASIPGRCLPENFRLFCSFYIPQRYFCQCHDVNIIVKIILGMKLGCTKNPISTLSHIWVFVRLYGIVFVIIVIVIIIIIIIIIIKSEGVNAQL